jgi:hypothetical protein
MESHHDIEVAEDLEHPRVANLDSEADIQHDTIQQSAV